MLKILNAEQKISKDLIEKLKVQETLEIRLSIKENGFLKNISKKMSTYEKKDIFILVVLSQVILKKLSIW